jgi:acyl-CoA thioester hydrolase
MMRRKKGIYFERLADSPEPIVVRAKRRVNFNEADIMGVAWFGRYAVFFEEGNAALGKFIGISYKDYHAHQLRAPIVQFHVDYHKPLFLDEEFTIEARLVWCEGGRHNIEYSLFKEDGSLAASGYSVQLFIDDKSFTPCLVAPKLLEAMRLRWQKGEFKCRE